MLTQEQLKELLHYCPETGVWTWIVSRGGMKKGDVAGCVHTSSGKKYRRIKLFGSMRPAHRIAFLYVTGRFPENGVDHEDGNGLNNRWSNLREANSADNAKNQRLPANNTSGTVGIYFRKERNRWEASIEINRRHKSLGYFRNKDDAIAARKKAESELGYHPNHGTDRPL